MEDVLTEQPPPSRFFLEDLNNFAPPSPPLPSPIVFLSKSPLRPSLLLIALSTPSLYLLHHASSKTLIGTLILPEISSSGNSVDPSLRDKSCNLYALTNSNQESIIIANFQYSVPSERTHSIAKSLIGENIIPERVLILDSIQNRNFRGRLSKDDTFALKLETTSERKMPYLKSLNYFPSGSVIEGLGAALLSRCQMKNVKATLCFSWPEFGGSVTSMLKGILVKEVLPGVELDVAANGEDDDGLRFGHKNRYQDSELYT